MGKITVHDFVKCYFRRYYSQTLISFHEPLLKLLCDKFNVYFCWCYYYWYKFQMSTFIYFDSSFYMKHCTTVCNENNSKKVLNVYRTTTDEYCASEAQRCSAITLEQQCCIHYLQICTSTNTNNLLLPNLMHTYPIVWRFHNQMNNRAVINSIHF